MHSLPLTTEWPAASRANLAIRIAVGYSILFHVILLVIPMRERLPTPSVAGAAGPMTVELELPRTPATPAVEPVTPAPVPPARARRVPLAMPPRPLPRPPSETVPLEEPSPEPAPAPSKEPAFDMSALIAANRERRRALDAALARGPSASRGASSDPAADSLARNLASLSRGDDTGGVFQIMRMGVRTAEFSFNGWRAESRKKWREMIEVDAGPGGDVQRAVVRRMIMLIREHYTGNFNWESQKSGRVVVLSAAPENNEELEDYLMREFFDNPLVKSGR